MVVNLSYISRKYTERGIGMRLDACLSTAASALLDLMSAVYSSLC